MDRFSSPAGTDVYRLIAPHTEKKCPLLLDSPHSGTLIPPDFNFICALDDLRTSEDQLIDQLIAAAPSYGATTLQAEFTRSYIDLNRALDDLDPALCAGTPPWHLRPTKRTHYGLGLIHHLARSQAIYAEALSVDAIRHRTDHYYQPYQACLAMQLQQMQQEFGFALHLNMHAMPSRNIDGKPLPDIVIGDLDGTSAYRIWRDTIKDLFKQAGLVVSVNTPYKGVEIIRRTGKPRQGIHALQIEINKALYLDEQTLLPHAGFNDFRETMNSIWQVLSTIVTDIGHKQAAE